MKDLVNFLAGGNVQSLIIVFLLVILLTLMRWGAIVDFIKWAAGKVPRRVRSCGDCVLVLLGIREKYEYENRKLDIGLLRSQMTFFEQKVQELMFFLVQSFSEDLDKLDSDRSEHEKLVQLDLYRECLRNSLFEVKDEIRRSFKENGFADTSETEFSAYVRSKTQSLVSIAREYLVHHYPTSGMIVGLKYRFDKIDREYYAKIEGFAFSVFSYARDLVRDTRASKKRLKEKLSAEIDNFVNTTPKR